jgi:hypothetical protein
LVAEMVCIQVQVAMVLQILAVVVVDQEMPEVISQLVQVVLEL